LQWTFGFALIKVLALKTNTLAKTFPVFPLVSGDHSRIGRFVTRAVHQRGDGFTNQRGSSRGESQPAALPTKIIPGAKPVEDLSERFVRTFPSYSITFFK